MTQLDRAVHALRTFGCNADVVALIALLPDDIEILVQTEEGDDTFLPVTGAPGCQAALYAERYRVIVALEPHRAARLHSLTGYELVECNPTTVRVAIHGGTVAYAGTHDEDVLQHAMEAIAEALARSRARFARADGNRRQQQDRASPACPTCFMTLPATGLCDDHGRPTLS